MKDDVAAALHHEPSWPPQVTVIEAQRGHAAAQRRPSLRPALDAKPF
jgi:hypothetical protein